MPHLLSHRQSSHVVENFIQSFIQQKVFSQVKLKILNQAIHKKISTIGVKQASKLIFPKVMEQITILHQGYPQTQIKTDQMPQNLNLNYPLKKINKIPFNELKTFRQSQSIQVSSHYLGRQISSSLTKRQIVKFNRNQVYHSNPIQSYKNQGKIQLQKYQKLSVNLSKTQYIQANKQHKGKNPSQLNLIKLNDSIEKEDQIIMKIRKTFLRKKLIQKKLQKKFINDECQAIKQELLKNSHVAPARPLSCKFTTDYNGETIQFHKTDNTKKGYSREIDVKKNNFLKRREETSNYLPRKSLEQKQPKYEVKQNLDRKEEEIPFYARMKIKIRVKEQNFIQKISSSVSKNVPFQFLYNSRQQQKQSSSNSFDEIQDKIHNLQRHHQKNMRSIKTLRNFPVHLQINSIFKTLQLSPGVTFQNCPSESEEKQNQTLIILPSTKSIGKSIKNIFSHGHESTLKNILINNKPIKQQQKSRNTERKKTTFSKNNHF